MEPGAESAAGVSRLTDKERECLRRRLLPQTAKEMALDLGISPHAVEKRLKVARLKLDVPTSLAAARLLAAAEGYGSPVPHSSDLSMPAGWEERPRITADPGREPSRLPKGAFMILLPVLAFIAQDVAPRDQTAPPPITDERHLPIFTRRVGFDEAVAFEQEAFKVSIGTVPASWTQERHPAWSRATSHAIRRCRPLQHRASPIPPERPRGWPSSTRTGTAG